MATAGKLDYLLETKNQIKNAIIGKGVSVEDTDSFRSYASKIEQIESEGTGQDGDFADCITENSISDCSHIFQKLFKKMPNKLLNLIDIENIKNMTYMFNLCSNLTEADLSEFDTSKITNMSGLCYSCLNLIEIKGILDVIKVTSFSNAFSNCKNLVEIRIKNLNCTGLILTSCNKLSHNSLIYLIENLVETTTVKTITLGSINLAKLTDEEKAIATNKNWTLA